MDTNGSRKGRAARETKARCSTRRLEHGKKHLEPQRSAQSSAQRSVQRTQTENASRMSRATSRDLGDLGLWEDKCSDIIHGRGDSCEPEEKGIIKKKYAGCIRSGKRGGGGRAQRARRGRPMRNRWPGRASLTVDIGLEFGRFPPFVSKQQRK